MPFSAPAEDLLTPEPTSPAPAVTGGFSAPASELLDDQGRTPFDAASNYLHQAGDGLPADIDRTKPYEEQFRDFYGQAKAFHEVNPLVRLGGGLADVGTHKLDTAKGVLGAVGNLASQAYGGTKRALVQDAGAVLSNPFTASPKILASTALGGVEGLYGLGKLGAQIVGKGTDVMADLSQITPEAAAEYRARRDFMLRYYNTNIEQPARAKLDAVTPLPAQAAFAENVVPILLPGAGEASGAGLAVRGADALAEAAPQVVGQVAVGIGKGAQLAARGVEKAAPVVGNAVGTLVGGGHGGGLEALVGQGLGRSAGELVARGAGAVADSGALRSLSLADPAAAGRAVLRPLAGAAEGLTLGPVAGVLGAPSGSEEEGARRGAAFGLALAPLTALGAARAPRLEERPPVGAAPEPAATTVAPAPVPVVTAAPPAAAVPLAPLAAGSPARAEAFSALTRGDRLNPADANVRLNAAEAAGVIDDAAALLDFARTGRKQVPPVPPPGKPLALSNVPVPEGGWATAATPGTSLALANLGWA